MKKINLPIVPEEKSEDDDLRTYKPAIDFEERLKSQLKENGPKSNRIQISLKIEEPLLNQIKEVAKLNEVGYQTLIHQALKDRFEEKAKFLTIRNELESILKELNEITTEMNDVTKQHTTKINSDLMRSTTQAQTTNAVLLFLSSLVFQMAVKEGVDVGPAFKDLQGATRPLLFHSP